MIRFRALGAPDLRGDDATELREVLTKPRLLALLAYLTLARPRSHQRRDTLLALFWPEFSTEQARNALRQAVHRLRRALGQDVVAGRGSEELGIDRSRLWSDVVAFEDTLDAGHLEEALQLYRGDLLPGFHVADAPDFVQWLDGERERLRRRAVEAAWVLTERAAAANQVLAAAHWARTAAAFTPHDEAAVQRLIRALGAAGDHAGARRAYEAFAARLADDFGADPSPTTRALLPAPAVAPVAFPTSLPSDPVPVPAPPAEGGVVAPASRAGAEPARVPGRVLVVAVATVLALVATGALVRHGRPASAPATRALAVMPFTVRGGAEFGYLREAMVDLLSAELDGADGFHALDPRSVIGASTTEAPGAADASAQAARRLGASWYVRGDVVAIAGRLEVTAGLYDAAASSRPVATRTVSGEATALFELVDGLAGQLLAVLAPGRDTTLTRLAALTTNSLPALKAYLRGEQALRAGRDGEAVSAFREAVTLDTTFALAEYRLAVASTWAAAGDVDDANAWAEKAARQAERLSPLVRDLLEAYRAYRRFEPDEAERLYRTVTEGHPHNVEAWLMLGETLFHFNGPRGRSPMEAWPVLERVLALEPANPHAMIHLARLAVRDGRTMALDGLVRRYLAVREDAGRTLEMRALQTFERGDTAGEGVVADALTDASEITAVVILQDAILYGHSPAQARRLEPAVMRSGTPALLGLALQRTVTDLPVAAGQWMRDPARPLADADWLTETRALLFSDPLYPIDRARIGALRDAVAARRSYPPQALMRAPERNLGPAMRAYLLGLLSVRLGDSAAVAAQLAALEAQRDSGPPVEVTGLVAGLRAERARTAGDPIAALRELDRFAFTPTWDLAHWGARERFLRAELLHALGRDAEALPWYDSFTGAYDTPWLAGAHLRMGEIEERLGHQGRAAFHYARFLRLWSACDPELRPLVTRAEQGLARVGDRPD